MENGLSNLLVLINQKSPLSIVPVGDNIIMLKRNDRKQVKMSEERLLPLPSRELSAGVRQ